MAQFNTGFSNSPAANSPLGYSGILGGDNSSNLFSNGTPLAVPGASQGNNQQFGPSANPAAGPAGFNNPSAPQQYSPNNPATNPVQIPGAGGTPSPAPSPSGTPSAAPPSGGQQWFNGQNWNPSFQQNAGYNPSQYATLDTANTLAGAMGSGLGLGGKVIQTSQSQGPFNVPQQYQIDFGGEGILNAGLLAERYKKYDHATADRMTRDELAALGRGGGQGSGSSDGTGFRAQFAEAPGGSQNSGGGQNIGQFLGANAGSNFGSRPSPQPQPQSQWQGGGPGQGGGYNGQGGGYAGGQQGGGNPQYGGGQGNQGGYGGQGGGQQSFGNQSNYGGFGQAGQFQGANQNAALMQFFQMLMGGQGGNFQTRGRSNSFGRGGQMSSMYGQPSFLQRNNQATGNGFHGANSPYRAGNMSGYAGAMNSFQNPGQGGPSSQNGGSGQLEFVPQGNAYSSDNPNGEMTLGGTPGFYNSRPWSPINQGGYSPSANTQQEMDAQNAQRAAQYAQHGMARPNL